MKKRYTVVSLGFINPIVRPFRRIKWWGVYDTVEARIVWSGGTKRESQHSARELSKPPRRNRQRAAPLN